VDNTDSSGFESHTEAPYITIDAETTTHNKGHPFDPRNKLISYAFKSDICNFRYHTDVSFKTPICRNERSVDVYVGFNFKFDWHWLHHLLNPSVKIWDCQLAEHIYTGQKAQYISLNECLEKYGLETKKDLVKEFWDNGVQTDEIPIHILQEYNEWDVLQTEKLFLVQQELLSDEQKNLVYLMGEDLKTLAAIEQAGVLVDQENARKALEQYERDVSEIESKLRQFLPPIHHGVFNWDSGDHLSCFLYGGTIVFDYAESEPAVYKSGAKKGEAYVRNHWHTETISFPGFFKPLEGSEIKKTKDNPLATTRLFQVDYPTLSSLKGGGKTGKEVVALLQARSKTQKLVEMFTTIFKLFDKYRWQDNLMHGQYNQNVAVTGRLSSSNPNQQNFAPEIDKVLVSRYV
jgi:DNA polymerase I-like protein with 3'-5' exonuclease and polymerase domains